MNFRKNSRGITLIALVITIIVLLILAGVSLSLVTGNNGILGKAKTSADRTKEASAKEQVELKIAEYQTEYYYAVYVNKDGTADVNTKKGDWIAKNKKGEQKTEDYTFTITGSAPYKVTIKKDKTIKSDIEGSLSEDGILSWASSGGGASNTLSSLGISNNNIGNYIDLGNNIVGTEATTDDWRILYVDSQNSKVYAILADYLPNGNIPAGDNITKKGYSVWSTNGVRDSLLNYLTDTNKWNDLANGISRATVTGGPTGELLMNSYNTKKETSLVYTDYPTLDTTESLYVPHTSEVSADSQPTYGYWLASPRADKAYNMLNVYRYGSVNNDYCGTGRFAVRPVVCLPSDISASKDGNVWKVEK